MEETHLGANADSFSEASTAFEQGDLERATALCHQIINAGQESSQVYGLLARIYHGADQPGRADEMFRKSLALDRHNGETIFYLSAFLEEYGKFEDALRAYRSALTYDSGYAERRINRALRYFRDNDLERGWREYEFRSTLEKPGAWIDRFWDGSDLTDKTVLVIGEQGIGDQIMFATCLPELIKIAGHVIIEPDARLVPMFRETFAECTVIGERHFTPNGERRQAEVDAVEADVAVMMGGMPRFFRPTLDAFPETAPRILNPDREAVEKRRLDLPGGDKTLKIGIAWRSLYPTPERADKYAPLEAWAPLFENHDATFVSLQANLADDERQMLSQRFGVELVEVPGIDLVDDMEGMTALIAALDGVVSAKTYVAWFAAGAGIPTWRVNTGARRDDPWLFGRQTLSWFPNMTVYCEQDDGGFGAIFRIVADDLSRREDRA